MPPSTSAEEGIANEGTFCPIRPCSFRFGDCRRQRADQRSDFAVDTTGDNTGDAFETVNATMASRDNPTVAGTAKGRAISLLCQGRGMLMGAPLLGGCSVK